MLSGMKDGSVAGSSDGGAARSWFTLLLDLSERRQYATEISILLWLWPRSAPREYYELNRQRGICVSRETLLDRLGPRGICARFCVGSGNAAGSL